MVEYDNVELIEEQPIKQICDHCKDRYGPWYYFRPVYEICTYTICEGCADELQEVDEDEVIELEKKA